MKICVTGACGFIGYEIIKKLREVGLNDIVAVDDGSKIKYYQKFDDFWDYQHIAQNDKQYTFLQDCKMVIHLGANSSTRASKEELFANNYLWSVELLEACNKYDIPIIFASSASIYGCKREGNKINPQTAYASYKYDIENLISNPESSCYKKTGQAVSLRLHNVYGTRESHKGNMASIICKWIDNALDGIKTNDLFNGSDKILRDFVHVDDVVNAFLVFMAYYVKHGSFPHYYTIDIGTSKAVSFESVAKKINRLTKGVIQSTINPYTEENYQWLTKANTRVYKKIFKSVMNTKFIPISIEAGIKKVYNEKITIHNFRNNNSSSAVEGI